MLPWHELKTDSIHINLQILYYHAAIHRKWVPKHEFEIRIVIIYIEYINVYTEFDEILSIDFNSTEHTLIMLIKYLGSGHAEWIGYTL